MKLYGFRIHRPWRNVEVWEWRRTRLGFLTVLTTGVVSALPEAEKKSMPPFRKMSSFIERFKPLAFRSRDGRVTPVPAGYIITTSLSDTLDFLAETAVPCGEGPIDQYLREAAAGSLTAAQLRDRLGNLLWHGGRCRRWSGDEANRRLDLQVLYDAPIAWYGDKADLPSSSLTPVEQLDGPHLFPTEPWRYLVCTVESPFAGLVLPRIAWFRVDPDEHLLGFWDGDRTHGRTAWDDVPRELRRRLVQHGTALPLGRDAEELQFLADVDLEAQFVLRVPPAEPAPEPRRTRPRQRVLRCAALLVDSRWPIRLPARPGRLPVIEDPEVVRYVLHRTTPNGIYVPDMPPQAQAAAFAPGTVLIGTLPHPSAPDDRS